MRHLDRDALVTRTEDIIFNVHTFSKGGEVSLDPKAAVTYYWLARLAGIQEECRIRGEPLPDLSGGRLGDELGLPLEGDEDPVPARAYEAVEEAETPDDPYLVKYGEREWLEETYRETGQLRLPSASSIEDDESLNMARRDEELVESLYPDPSRATLTPIDQETGEQGDRITPLDLEISRERQSDCYLFCMSQALMPRLFYDFDADGCLLIRNPEPFLERLITAVSGQLEGWHVGHGAVRYYDPLTADPDQINVLINKHFRYSYQREYRLAWLSPDERVANLEPFYVKVGPVDDLAQLILL